MAGLNLSNKLVGAGAQASTDFANAQANASVQFTGELALNRGLQIEIGIGAFTEASAAFSKFINASIKGTAFARASAGVQFQLPFNLFKDFGFIAKAQAIAEVGAGVEAGIGISIGDFIRIIERVPEMQGLPIKLIIMFLEEVDVSAKFGISVSLAAKAHANFNVTGRVIDVNGQPPGFFYNMSAGVGLLKGVAKSMTAGVQFKDFRRFYGRATDLTVDSTIQYLQDSLPENYKQYNPVLGAFAPVAKIAMRTAFEIGSTIASSNVTGSKDETQQFCNESIKIILEEVQRFIYQQIVNFACAQIRAIIELEINGLTNGAWDNTYAQRVSLSDALMDMPQEPFQPTPENFLYWEDLIKKAIAFAVKLYENEAKVTDEIAEGISLLYCAAELLFEAIVSKVNNASAYAGTIVTGTVTATTQSFNGPLRSQPDELIKKFINVRLGNRPADDLTYDNLLDFIINDVIIDSLIDNVPAVEEFISIFEDDFVGLSRDLLKTFLRNTAAFVGSGNGNMDATETLRLVVSALDKFITDKFKAEVLPLVLGQISNPMIKMYFEEVLFGAVMYAKDMGLKTLINWEEKTPSKDDFTEALSGIMMLLMGRSVIVLGDAFLTHLQEIIQGACDQLASDIKNNTGNIAPIAHLITDEDLKRLITDCLTIAGEVLGPFPSDTRTRVRQLLYQTIEPLNPVADVSIFDRLADQCFIPNGDKLQSLAYEFANISKDRFILFATRFVGAIANYILEKLEELILAAIDLILNWETHLAESLRILADFLRDLRRHVIELNAAMISAMSTLEDFMHSFLNTLGSSDLRTRIKNDLKTKFVDKTFSALEDNDIYNILPGFIKTGLEDGVNGVVSGLLNNPIVNPIFDIIAVIANELDDLLPDFRQLKPTDNLPPKVLGLILDKIEEKLSDHFGSTSPQINVGLDFSYEEYYLDWDLKVHSKTKHVHISLGAIKLNFDVFIDLIRSAINALDFYTTALNEACFKLADFLAAELDLIAKQLEHDENQTEHDRVNKINSEHNNDPKDICILSPTDMAHFDDVADIKIHLGGMSASNLGINTGEMQTIYIYLNSKMILPKSLIVEEAINEQKPGIHLNDFDLRALPGFQSSKNVFKNNRTTIVLNTAEHVVSEKKASQPKTSSEKMYFNNYTFNEHPSTLNSFSKAKIANDGKPTHTKQNVGKDKNGRSITNHNIINLKPGKNLTTIQIGKIVNEIKPGLYLSFKAYPNELINGLNVLNVVVIERGGNRHQKSVTFSFDETVVADKPVKGDKIDKPIGEKGKAIPHLPDIKLGKSINVGKGRSMKPVTFTVNVKKVKKGVEVIEKKKVKSILPVTSAAILKSNQKAVTYLNKQLEMNIKSLSIKKPEKIK